MVDTLHPADAVSGAPSYTGRKLRQTQSPFVGGATSARPLGARSGCRPGTPSSTVTASSTTWTVQPFAGIADLEAAVEAGPYGFAFDAVATGAMTAAHATLARQDGMYVQIDDPAESDGTATPVARRLYLAGTAGSGTPPTTPARSFRIATIAVPASGGGSPTVTWEDVYAVAAGGILPVPAGVRPSNPHKDQYIGDATAGLLRYDGSTWVSVFPAATTGSPTLSTNITNLSGYTPRLEKNGNIVTLQFGVANSAATGTAVPGSGVSMMTLPVGFRPTANTLVFGSGVNNGGIVPITFTVDTSGVVKANPSSALGGGASLFGAISFSIA